MSRKILVAAAAAAIGIAVAGYLWFGAGWTTNRALPPEPLRIALISSVSDSLVIIAQERALFQSEGLDVKVTYYPNGSAALAGMLKGEVDIASVAETPIVFSSLGRDDFSIVATTSAFDDYPKIVGRKSRGVLTPADLRGKRVATQKGSAIQFFLHVFMAKYGLTRKDVHVLFIPQEELVDALAAGKIDAFAMREPHVTKARLKLGDDATVFAAPGLYTMTTNLTASKRFIRERPETIKRTLRALIRAERYASEKPDEVIGLVAKRTGIAGAEVASLLENAKIGVALDQALLFTLEEEARWAIDNKLTPAVDLPNYLNFIYLDALQSLKPSAVTLIR